MSILIIYGTVEGQTGKIAHFIRSRAAEAGLDARLFDTSDLTAKISFDGVDTVIAAASVHERRHPTAFEVFLATNAKELEVRRTLMISVSLSAAFPDGREDAQDYLDDMKMRTRFKPDEEMLVAGAIRGSSYDYFARQVVRYVVLKDRNFEPTVSEHEFTDWGALGERVTSFLMRQTAGV